MQKAWSSFHIRGAVIATADPDRRSPDAATILCAAGSMRAMMTVFSGTARYVGAVESLPRRMPGC